MVGAAKGSRAVVELEVFHSRFWILWLSALLLLVVTLPASAKSVVLRVDPHETDPGIETVQGPHIAVYDSQVEPRHRLVLFFSGTQAKAERSLQLDSTFAQWGFHAISLDYENTVAAASCGKSPDISCFDRYRETIVTGAPGSEKIQVSPANSILTRFEKLLLYLATHDPGGGWGEFLSGGKPVWGKVIVAGHSQGSGHAAYIAKMFAVDRVLMFSGPQDYFDNLHLPAPWQSRKGATAGTRFFAFLNLHDPYNVDHQVANCMALMGLSKRETTMVTPGTVIDGAPRILINDFPTKQYHGSTLFSEFTNVWEYMATAKTP